MTIVFAISINFFIIIQNLTYFAVLRLLSELWWHEVWYLWQQWQPNPDVSFRCHKHRMSGLLFSFLWLHFWISDNCFAHKCKTLFAMPLNLSLMTDFSNIFLFSSLVFFGLLSTSLVFTRLWTCIEFSEPWALMNSTVRFVAKSLNYLW